MPSVMRHVYGSLNSALQLKNLLQHHNLLRSCAIGTALLLAVDPAHQALQEGSLGLRPRSNPPLASLDRELCSRKNGYGHQSHTRLNHEMNSDR